MSKTYIPADLRRLVFERARDNCEYCLSPTVLALATHQIDHIIAEKHGGKTVAENLSLIVRATAQLLKINRPESVAERALLLEVGQLMVPDSTAGYDLEIQCLLMRPCGC